MPSGVTSARRRAVPEGMDTAIVWFRRDLRVHDHPALTAAHREADRVVPVFVLDPRLLDAGRFPVRATAPGSCSPSLRELRDALRERGGDLLVRRGRPEDVLPRWRARPARRRSTSPPTCRRSRWRATGAWSPRSGTSRHAGSPGNFVADVDAPRTKDGRPFAVFSPFHRAWEQLPRREVHGAPRALRVPAGLDAGEIPAAPGAGGRRAVPARGARPRASGCARWLAGGDRALRGPSRPPRRRHLGALALPALRLPVGARDRAARARQGRQGRGGVRAPARVARLLRPRPAPPPGNARGAYKAQFDAARVGGRRRRPRGLVRGPHRLPGGRRRRCASSCTTAGCTTARA